MKKTICILAAIIVGSSTSVAYAGDVKGKSVTTTTSTSTATATVWKPTIRL
jgi:hypothetical protein